MFVFNPLCILTRQTNNHVFRFYCSPLLLARDQNAKKLNVNAVFIQMGYNSIVPKTTECYWEVNLILFGYNSYFWLAANFLFNEIKKYIKKIDVATTVHFFQLWCYFLFTSLFCFHNQYGFCCADAVGIFFFQCANTHENISYPCTCD